MLALQNLILSGADRFTGCAVQPFRQLLDRSQWWSRREIEEHQRERLAIVIRNAYENIPFYRNLMSGQKLVPADIRGPEDLWKLPVISKDVLRRAEHGTVVSRNLGKQELISCASSGSTGTPFRYVVTKEAYSANKACLLRAFSWMGYTLGARYAKLSQQTRRSPLKRAQDLFNCSLYLAPSDLSAPTLAALWHRLQRFSPAFIRGYPDLMAHLVGHVEKAQLGGIDGLVAISTTGSTLYDEKRRKIEEGFGAPVFDSYSSEGGAITAQCEKHGHYHSAQEYAISEFAEAGPHAPVGAKRLIVTDLYNLAMPFIRYDTADLVTPAPGRCACGRELLAMERIVGREGDVLMTPDGRPWIVHDFSIYFSTRDEVEAFQVYQQRIDVFKIRIVAPRLSAAGIDEIRRHWMKKLGHDCAVAVETVEAIEPVGAGKSRLLVRDPDVFPVAA